MTNAQLIEFQALRAERESQWQYDITVLGSFNRPGHGARCNHCFARVYRFAWTNDDNARSYCKSCVAAIKKRAQ
jgi:hypothetical protein